MPRRPNVLLITTDQQRYDHLGLEGVRGIDTPNLDRLGREGTHFARAYTSSPVCTPARVTLLTGRYPSAHGAYSIGVSATPLPRPTLAELLAAAGYGTALYGKTHFVRREDEAAHIAGFADPPPAFFHTFSGPYLGFQHVQVSRGHTTNTTPDMHYRAFLERAGVNYARWFPDVEGKHDHFATGAWNIPPAYHDTSWVSGNTINWIREQAAEAPQRPWFCWASFQDPHEPYLCPEPWFSAVRREELQPYEGARPGEFENKPAFYGRAYNGDWAPYNDGHGVPSVFRREVLDEQALTALQATLGMVAFVDDRVGAIMEALQETGQADNTLIIYTTDHGDLHGHHGFWYKGLTAYDDCQRVPLLIWGPGLIGSVGTTGALANLVDIPRTILGLVGIEIPYGMQGSDLSPMLSGKAESVQDWTLVELQATERVYQQTFITDRYKLVVYRDSNEGELYDMREDPHQYHNLWHLPEYGELRADLLLRYVRANMEKEGRVHERQSFA